MKCFDARNIINLLMDGETHPQSSKAEEHIANCPECQVWQANTLNALAFIQDADDLPDIDISTAVMAGLPERHPAANVSVENIDYRYRLRQGLMGLAIGFAAVLLVLAFVLPGAVHGMRIGELTRDLCEAASMVYGIARVFGSVIRPISGCIHAFRAEIIAFLMIDTTVLFTFFVLLRKRFSLTNISSILG